MGNSIWAHVDKQKDFSNFFIYTQVKVLTGRGGLGVERLLHKRRDSATAVRIPGPIPARANNNDRSELERTGLYSHSRAGPGWQLCSLQYRHSDLTHYISILLVLL